MAYANNFVSEKKPYIKLADLKIGLIYPVSHVFKCNTKYGPSIVVELDCGFVHLPSAYVEKNINKDGELDEKFIAGTNFFRYHGAVPKVGGTLLSNTDFPYLTYLRTGCFCPDDCVHCKCYEYNNDTCSCVELARSPATTVVNFENYKRKVNIINNYFDGMLSLIHISEPTRPY